MWIVAAAEDHRNPRSQFLAGMPRQICLDWVNPLPKSEHRQGGKYGTSKKIEVQEQSEGRH